MCRSEMFVPPVGFAGNFCWGLPRAALGKKKNHPWISVTHTHNFLACFSSLTGHGASHMIYLAGIKHAVLDALPEHPSFHGAVGGTVLCPWCRWQGSLLGGSLCTHSVCDSKATLENVLFVLLGQSNFMKETQPKLV